MKSVTQGTFARGGYVGGPKNSEVAAVVHPECVQVSREVFDKFGADLIRKITGNPSAEIIVMRGGVDGR